MNNEELKLKRAEQKRAYRKAHQTINLSFLNEEASEIQNRAEEKGMDIPKYLKALVKADIQGENIVLSIDQEKAITDLIIEIKRIGNSTNQIIRYIHTSKEVTYDDIKALQIRLSEIERSVMEALKNSSIIEEHT